MTLEVTIAAKIAFTAIALITAWMLIPTPDGEDDQ